MVQSLRLTGHPRDQYADAAGGGRRTADAADRDSKAPLYPKVSLKERLLQLKQKSENVIVIMAQRIREFILTITVIWLVMWCLAFFAAVIALGFLFFYHFHPENMAMLMSFGFAW